MIDTLLLLFESVFLRGDGRKGSYCFFFLGNDVGDNAEGFN
jgi:hypothetical protein